MIGTVAAVVLALAPEPARVRLEWSAPPQCPDREHVAARAERLLLASDAELAARGRIEQVGSEGFALELSIENAGATRVHRHVAADCVALAGVAALLIAVTADPVAVTAAGEVAARAEPVDPLVPLPPARDGVTAPRDSAEPPAPAPADVRATAKRPRLGGWIRVAGVVGVAQLPTIDAGLGIAGALTVDRWRVELGVTYLFAQRRDVPGLAPASILLSAVNTSLRGCGELGPRRWRIGACLGPEVGAMIGRSDDVSAPETGASPWVALLVGPALRWRPIDRVQLHLAVDGVIALARPEFALSDDESKVVTAGAGGLRATLGVAIGLGRGEIDRKTPRR